MKKLIIKLHQWALSHPAQTRAFHATWQTFLGVFLTGISPVLKLITSHNFADVKVALFALIGAAIAAALSTAKSQLWPLLVNQASSTTSHITQDGNVT